MAAIDGVPVLGAVAGIFKTMFASPEKKFKDSLIKTLEQQGVDKETLDRLREVFDSGKDEDLTAKLDELVRGQLVGKDGNPIELKDAQGEPIKLDRESIGAMAKASGVPTKSIDPTCIGPQPWEEPENPDEPADDTSRFLPPTQWVRG